MITEILPDIDLIDNWFSDMETQKMFYEFDMAMELNKKLLAKITAISRCVDYGRITFYLNPENKTVNFTIETTHVLPIEVAGTPAADGIRKVIIKSHNRA